MTGIVMRDQRMHSMPQSNWTSFSALWHVWGHPWVVSPLTAPEQPGPQDEHHLWLKNNWNHNGLAPLFPRYHIYFEPPSPPLPPPHPNLMSIHLLHLLNEFYHGAVTYSPQPWAIRHGLRLSLLGSELLGFRPGVSRPMPYHSAASPVLSLLCSTTSKPILSSSSATLMPSLYILWRPKYQLVSS